MSAISIPMSKWAVCVGSPVYYTFKLEWIYIHTYTREYTTTMEYVQLR